jgi:hypothetical protein
MANIEQALPAPRLAGARLLFSADDGQMRIDCAISRSALLDLAEQTHLKPADLLSCFIRKRTQIEAAAWAKFHRNGGAMTGIVNLWSGDFDAAAVPAAH